MSTFGFRMALVTLEVVALLGAWWLLKPNQPDEIRGSAPSSSSRQVDGPDLLEGAEQDTAPTASTDLEAGATPKRTHAAPRLVGRYVPSFRPAPDTHTFRGHVTDAATGEPLQRVYLDVHADTGRKLGSATTDEDGHYSLKRVLPKRPAAVRTYALRFDYLRPDAPNFATGSNGYTVHDIALTKRKCARGYVVDQNGAAISGAEVSLILEVDGAETTVESDKTSAEGFFFLRKLMPPKPSLGGAGSLRVTHAGRLTTVVPKIYKLSATERNSIRVVLSRGHTVRGRLLNDDGTPAQFVGISARSDEDTLPPTNTNLDGEFELAGVNPGELVLSAFNVRTRSVVKRRLNVRGAVEGLVLQLAPWSAHLVGASTTFAGITFAAIDYETGVRLEIDGFDQGLLVLGVKNRTTLLSLRLRAGDIIKQVNGDDMLGVRQFIRALTNVPSPRTHIQMVRTGKPVRLLVEPADRRAAKAWLRDNP